MFCNSNRNKSRFLADYLFRRHFYLMFLSTMTNIGFFVAFDYVPIDWKRQAGWADSLVLFTRSHHLRSFVRISTGNIWYIFCHCISLSSVHSSLTYMEPKIVLKTFFSNTTSSFSSFTTAGTEHQLYKNLKISIYTKRSDSGCRPTIKIHV